MANLPIALLNLQATLGKLPGIGPKSAQRIAFWLINQPQETSEELVAAIDAAAEQIQLCPQCFNYTDGSGLCGICSSKSRNQLQICIVSEPKDVTAFELAGGYQGVYHVLGGLISPMDGIGPDDLHLKELYKRIKELCSKNDNKVEVIIATSFNSSGLATASYIQDELAKMDCRAPLRSARNDAIIKITRLATGLPVGGEVDLADAKTLAQSLRNRQPF